MFNSARLKLTAWYLLMIMLVSTVFSLTIYRVEATELERFARAQRFRIERRYLENQRGSPLPPRQNLLPPPDPELVNETEGRLLLTLLAINGGILLFSAGMGYFLAGRTLKPIQEMMEEQNRFISDASHELKTPLTSLKAAIEVNLRDKNLRIAEVKTLLSQNLGEVNKLQSLTESLLQLTRYQKTVNKMQFEILSLSAIANEAVKKIAPIASEKRVTLRKELADRKISGNKDALINLLVILLDNAVKYSPEKSVVRISAREIDHLLVITVKDQGIGINKEDLPYIFDRFYRADSARQKSGAGGYGLGLAIAKKITESHHGTISVQSQPGEGTTISVSLPLIRAGS